jgi:hypothetical protein
MRSSVYEHELDVEATAARVTDDSLLVELEDGRTISCPLAWYPRLLHAKRRDRNKIEVSGLGLHWPQLDEDLSVRGIILGRKSGESPESFKFWLDNYKEGRKVTLEDFVKSRRSGGRKKSA